MDLLVWAAAVCVVVIVLTLAGAWQDRRRIRQAHRRHAAAQLAEFAAKLQPRQ